MLAVRTETDQLASRIDLDLCGLCGDLRMRDRSHDDAGEGNIPGDVIAERLAFVRRDIGDLIIEVRTQFAENERRQQAMANEIRAIQSERKFEAGKREGISATITWIIALAGLLGGAVGWIISHIPWGGKTP